jgi:hypothetical protein
VLSCATLVQLLGECLQQPASSFLIERRPAGENGEQFSSVEVVEGALLGLCGLACSLGPMPGCIVRMACALQRLGLGFDPDVGRDAGLRRRLGRAGALGAALEALDRGVEEGEQGQRMVGLAMRLLVRLLLDDENRWGMFHALGQGDAVPAVEALACPPLSLRLLSLLRRAMGRFPTDVHVQGNGCLLLADLDGHLPCPRSALWDVHGNGEGVAYTAGGGLLCTDDLSMVLRALSACPAEAEVQVCGLAACARLAGPGEDHGRQRLWAQARTLITAARTRHRDDPDVELLARTVDQGLDG